MEVGGGGEYGPRVQTDMAVEGAGEETFDKTAFEIVAELNNNRRRFWELPGSGSLTDKVFEEDRKNVGVSVQIDRFVDRMNGWWLDGKHVPEYRTKPTSTPRFV
jgi:hypothetical protein